MDEAVLQLLLLAAIYTEFVGAEEKVCKSMRAATSASVEEMQRDYSASSSVAETTDVLLPKLVVFFEVEETKYK